MALYDVSTTEKKTSPELVAGGILYADNPLGTILPFGSATIPTGWLLCDGTAISRSTYSELFAVIGTSFGAGDGSTTFNLPDMRGKVPVGFNTSETEFNALGNTGGEKTHTLTVSEMPSHSHKISDSDSKKGIYDNFVDSSSGTYNRTTFQSCSAVSDPIDTTSTGGSTAHNNLQPYNTVNYIIKAKMIAVPADFLDAVDEAVEDVMNVETGTFADGKGEYEKSGHIVRYVYQISDTVSAGIYTLSIPYAPITLFANPIFWGPIIVGHVAVQPSAKTMSLEIETDSQIHVEAMFITAD